MKHGYFSSNIHFKPHSLSCDDVFHATTDKPKIDVAMPVHTRQNRFRTIQQAAFSGNAQALDGGDLYLECALPGLATEGANPAKQTIKRNAYHE
ncbi:hypothetical protein ACFQPC_02170 [Herminiimonas glaciei]|uniref:Hsp20/alpha crystallin family protein n=1 Tax=Herminiimonas glaciei TaxID=523788 RepID=A0ABW2I769_9BURK